MSVTIAIAESDDRWPARFSAERDALSASLAGAGGLVAIEHIGSTSVPGLAAKPIVDIMAGVERLAIVNDRWLAPLGRLGYEYISAYEIEFPMRRYFRKPGGTDRPRSHHLHIVEPTSDFWRRHLLFRDWLRSHPEDARAYAALKRHLAAIHGEDRVAYTDGKTEFIEEILARAYAAES